MITAFILCHPQSVDLLPADSYHTPLAKLIRIACGTNKVNADLSEASDFYPTYASWNSALFETSVILTLWEHSKELIGDGPIAILHSDIKFHFSQDDTWHKIGEWLNDNPDSPIGLTAPSTAIGIWDDWLIPNSVKFIPKHDPMLLHSFDNNVRVWDYIKEYDADLFYWAMDTQPRLIYSHQFACSRSIFDKLGNKLYSVVQKLRLRDIGFWTPHMFERLIALYLARLGTPILSTCFWHYSSSGAAGPGDLSLYGSRPRRYYHLSTKWNQKSESAS